MGTELYKLSALGLLLAIEAVAQPAPKASVQESAYQTPPTPLGSAQQPNNLGASRAVAPAGNPGNWITNIDYPTEALRAGIEGVTSFQLKVDPLGKPTSCTITIPSGTPELDEATCALLLRRARFSPALDVNGKPISGQWSSRFRWKLPKDSDLPAITIGSRVTTFVVEADGTTSRCQIFINGIEQFGVSAGSACAGSTKYRPILDAQGRPVRKKITMTVKLETSDALD